MSRLCVRQDLRKMHKQKWYMYYDVTATVSLGHNKYVLQLTLFGGGGGLHRNLNFCVYHIRLDKNDTALKNQFSSPFIHFVLHRSALRGNYLPKQCRTQYNLLWPYGEPNGCRH